MEPTADPPGEGRLDSWKKIAGYLKRDVTTVQRWEKREGMPVHRHQHDKSGSVYAFRSELDAWTQSRRNSSQPIDASSEAAAEPAAAGFQWDGRHRRVALLACLLAVIVAVAIVFWRGHSDQGWQSPLAGATFTSLTGFVGENEAAAISRDGQFVAFLSDRGGRTDVWVTQVGSGQFHNLTQGLEGELVNPSVRTLGFSPDGSSVLFWRRLPSRRPGEDISIWSVPTLGGEPKPYLEGAAEVTFSPDGKRLAYHTTQNGDPLFLTEVKDRSRGTPLLTAPAGLHSHFQLWAADDLIYFVKGTLPDQLDIWRTGLTGENAERITSRPAELTFPVLLDRRTLLYLATAPDGSGPWIYGMDLRHRLPFRLTSEVEQYTSLAASANGRRLIATVSEPERTLWRVAIGASGDTTPLRMPLTTGNGYSPRFGPNYVLFVTVTGTGDSIWKSTGAAPTQLWAGADGRILGAPAISADGGNIAFVVQQQGHTLLYAMAADGSQARVISDALELRGSPAWEPDGHTLTVAAEDNGTAHLFHVPVDGGTAKSFVSTYSRDPTWSPDGRFVMYSGPDVGTHYSVGAVTAASDNHAMPPLTLTRGSRHLVALNGGDKVAFLQGEIHHKNVWTLDLRTGVTQQVTHLPADFELRDFDIAADGIDAILERSHERSDVVMIDRAAD
jgi:Tol biopolymer transport system component